VLWQTGNLYVFVDSEALVQLGQCHVVTQEDVVVVGVDDHLLDEPVLLPGAARLLSKHASSHCVEGSSILLVASQTVRCSRHNIAVNDGAATYELVVLVNSHHRLPVPLLCLEASLDISITPFSSTANVHIKVQPVLLGVQPIGDVVKVFKGPRLTNSLNHCLPDLTALYLLCFNLSSVDSFLQTLTPFILVDNFFQILTLFHSLPGKQ